jgi:hypothetical protein
MSEAASRSDPAHVELLTQLTIRLPCDDQAPPERCCPSHPSWDVLFDHLRVEFPTVPPERILSLLAQASSSMEIYALDGSTTLGMAETVTRFQLGMTVGHSIETIWA